MFVTNLIIYQNNTGISMEGNLYSKERMKVIRSHIMKQNGDFQEGISQA